MKVSVATPTKDRPSWLPKCVRSIQAQTYGDWQHIIYDVSHPRIQHLVPSDPRFLYASGEAQGPVTDFNVAHDLGDGDICHFLSDDDMLLPDAFQIVVDSIGSADWVLGKTVLVNPEGDVICYRGGDQESVDQTMAGSYMLGGAVFFRRSLIAEVGGRLSVEFEGAPDFDLYTRFVKHSKPVIVPDVLHCYVDHPGTDSNVNAARQRETSERVARSLQ